MLEASPKPYTHLNRPELTRLPGLNPWRRVARAMLRGLAWLLVRAFTQVAVSGLENFPPHGAALVATNHLGDADVLIGLVFFPRQVESLAKLDLYIEYPVLGWLMDCYGVIWVHRGRPDRRALRAALQGLAEGRLVGVAPEGRESLTGGLEEGTGGAAYLALKTGVPVVPVTYTQTENARIYGNMKRLRRTRVTITVGPAFHLAECQDWRESVKQGTRTIMLKLAQQLPREYRGLYQLEVEQ